MIKPKAGPAVTKHVLGNYGAFEKKTVEDMKERAIEALKYIMSHSPLEAMNKFN